MPAAARKRTATIINVMGKPFHQIGRQERHVGWDRSYEFATILAGEPKRCDQTSKWSLYIRLVSDQLSVDRLHLRFIADRDGNSI